MVGRRSFARLVGAGAAGTSLTGWSAASAAAPAGAAEPEALEPVRTRTSFGPLRQIRAGELDVGYAEAGPAHGPAVVLLHGWPYDIHSFVDVAPLLAARGYRVIVPYLRGHGTTRFLSDTAFRNAQQSVVALDIIALMDALGIGKAVLAGFDWGSRTAGIIAALRPERCTALVSVTGYLITDRRLQQTPLGAQDEWAWWYQYYFSTERGRAGLQEHGRDLARLVWTFNSRTWDFDDATFERSATAIDNPDYVSIVIHNYRWRLGLAEGDPRYDALEEQLAAGPAIARPTVVLYGERDPFTPKDVTPPTPPKFTGPYAQRILRGVGHNVPQEAPREFAEAVVEAHRMSRP